MFTSKKVTLIISFNGFKYEGKFSSLSEAVRFFTNKINRKITYPVNIQLQDGGKGLLTIDLKKPPTESDINKFLDKLDVFN